MNENLRWSRRALRRTGRSHLMLLGSLAAAAAGGCDLRYDVGEGSPAAQADSSRDASPAPPLPEGAEAWSLLGRPLVPPEPSAESREVQETFLAEARSTLEEDPDDADAAIWVGRRLAYLGRYGEAIETYTAGIARHPGDARFYRHRGHRHITLRRFDEAIADFRSALELVSEAPDQIEPDGLPNAAGIPLSTLHFNIWYHLGLAHYLSGDLEAALQAYRRCMEVSVNPDLQVATAHWLYMTLRELGNDDEAARVLEPFSDDLEIIENHSYHQLLLLYRGERSPEDLLGDPAAATASAASIVYGVGNWHRYNGDEATALDIFRGIVDGSDQWASFGYIAAEAALAREESRR